MTPTRAWALIDRKSGKVVWCGFDKPYTNKPDSWWLIPLRWTTIGAWPLEKIKLTRIRISPVAKKARKKK